MGIISRDSLSRLNQLSKFFVEYHVTTYSFEFPIDMYRLCGLRFNSV